MRLKVLLLVAALTACASQRPSPAVEAAAPALHDGWNTIAGPPGTGCAQDSAFRLLVRPGAPDKLLIFLNGGGACWRAADCNTKGRGTYTTRADTANDPTGGNGIFATDNPKNPLRNFTMVFVPYCTGDVHLGARTSQYELPDSTAPGGVRRFAVRHQGAANLEFALSWVQSNIRNPTVIVVTGSSAGAIPSPVLAERLALANRRARVVQLGDGAGAYHTPGTPRLMSQWGATDYLRRDPVYRDLDSASFYFEALYTRAAHAAPRVTFAQYNAVDDATQGFFLSLLGIRGIPLSHFLTLGLDELHAAIPSFRAYTAPGRVHTILRSNAVYTTTVDGVAFVDWLSALVEGRAISDVGASLLAPGH
ncbi:MAG: hypothetical protein JWO05_3155 [Gemmatimonadetes bacterium]|nr:hypothetical protein [Gemmatimonadota bacterium]